MCLCVPVLLHRIQFILCNVKNLFDRADRADLTNFLLSPISTLCILCATFKLIYIVSFYCSFFVLFMFFITSLLFRERWTFKVLIRWKFQFMTFYLVDLFQLKHEHCNIKNNKHKYIQIKYVARCCTYYIYIYETIWNAARATEACNNASHEFCLRQKRQSAATQKVRVFVFVLILCIYLYFMHIKPIMCVFNQK